MFLDNWYKLLASMYKQPSTLANSAWNATVVDTSGSAVTDRGISQVSGNNVGVLQLFTTGITNWTSVPSIYKLSNNSTIYCGSSTETYHAAYAGVIIGDGDTAPTLSDYSLSGNQITTFTATTQVDVTYSFGKIIGTATYNITNTSASPIIIKEIGLTKEKAGEGNRILLARSVLETPVTIAPGDTGVVTYKIEIS